MKRFFLSFFMLTAMLATSTLCAQQTGTDSDHHKIIIIKATDKNGETTVLKKRIEKEQDFLEILQEMDVDDIQQVKVEVSIADVQTDNGNEEETLFLFRDNNQRIEISGKGDTDNNDAPLELLIPHHNRRFSRKQNEVLLGVYPESGERGVVINGIVRESGAEKAGLKKGDIITTINGSPVQTVQDLNSELSKYKPGNVVTVGLLRDNQALTIPSKLTKRPAPRYSHERFRYHSDKNTRVERDPCKVFFGIMTGGYGKGLEGVGVAGIIKGNDWPADVAGIQKGDRILAIDGVAINTYSEMVAERDKHQPGETFTFTYLRDGEIYEVEAKFKECPDSPSTGEVAPPLPEQPATEDNQPDIHELIAYPNPTVGNLQVRFRGEAVPTVVRVIDTNGKIVYEENIRHFDGYYHKTLDISKGTVGTLILSVSQNGETITKPVILITRA